jgi:hypothetical protein
MVAIGESSIGPLTGADPMKTLCILVVADDFWIGTLLAEMLEKMG